MRKLTAVRFASRNTRFFSQRGTRLSRSVRLHAEQLEDRLLMSGNEPDGGDIQAIVPVSPIIDIVRLPIDVLTPYQPPVVAPSASAENPGPPFEPTTEFDRWLVESAIAQWGHLFGRTTYYPLASDAWAPIFRFGDAVALDGAMLLATNAVGGSANSVSDTNLQVAGVDEADLVETDGQYLYIISGEDLVIVEAGDGDNLRVVSRVHLEERPAGMYLSGDRLAIVSSQGQGRWQSTIGGDMLLFAADWMPYDPQPPITTVTVLDVADRAAPALVQKTEMDGQLVTSRVVDGQLRLVLSNQLNLPAPIARPVYAEASPRLVPVRRNLEIDATIDFSVIGDHYAIDVWYPDPSQPYYVYETQDEYLARVRDEILGSICPTARTFAVDGSVLSETPLIATTDLHRSGSSSGRYVTTVATIDLGSNEAGPAATASVMTNSETQTYATADSIYVFDEPAQVWQPDDTNSGNGTWVNKTAVWKFAIDAESHAIEMVAKGEFAGALLNHFDADEHDGYLRVVTSSGWDSMGQNLFVLQQVGERLEVVGRIERIAAGERLHSVRFMGDRGFVVTFRQVDPLFALDLSDPTNPKLMGELVIPGVSGYLQPIDDNHLLGVGRAMDPSGWMFGDLELSIFDISDLTDPQLLHRFAFDGGWSTTTPVLDPHWIPFTGDHHAAGYFPEEHIFTIPVFSTAGGNLDGVESTPFFEPGEGGLQVFRIDVGAGFTPLAFIEHETRIERSVQIGDRLFAISSGTVSVHDLADPRVRLGEVGIGAETGGNLVELTMYQPPIEALAAATLSPTASNAEDQMVDPRLGWALPSSEESRHAKPARAAAFANLARPRRLDAELIQLLARETARRESSTAGPDDQRLAQDGAEDDAFRAVQLEDLVSTINSYGLERELDDI